jgi:hypothetical protein
MKKVPSQKELKSKVMGKRIDPNFSSRLNNSDTFVAKEKKICNNSGTYEHNNLNGQITGVKIFSKHKNDLKLDQKLQITGSVMSSCDSENLQNFKQTKSKMTNRVFENCNNNMKRFIDGHGRNLSIKIDRANIPQAKNPCLETPSLFEVKACDATKFPLINPYIPCLKSKKLQSKYIYILKLCHCTKSNFGEPVIIILTILLNFD